MEYKKKIIILGSTAAFLALLYVLSILLDPARSNARNERFTWLPAASRSEADRIEINRGGEKLEMVLRNGSWFVLAASTEVPARQGRIDDLFRLLSTRGAFPRRGSNSGSHAELGLDGSTRLLVLGGAGLPLLDLIVGKEDPSGTGVFLRKNGENEFRSGDKLIGSYVNGEKTAWYDLKLFEERSPAQVQRVQVHFSGYTGIDEESPVEYGDYTVTRSGEDWVMSGSSLDREKTETWIRGILEAQGDDVLPANDELGGLFQAVAGIRVELGDGSVLEMQIEQAGEDGKSPTQVSGKPYRIVLSRWTLARLFREQGSFAK